MECENNDLDSCCLRSDAGGRDLITASLFVRHTGSPLTSWWRTRYMLDRVLGFSGFRSAASLVTTWFFYLVGSSLCSGGREPSNLELP